jgi:tetratricopeptide (TPR) repeat protein
MKKCFFAKVAFLTILSAGIFIAPVYSNNFQTAQNLMKHKKYNEAIQYLKQEINKGTADHWFYNNIVYCYIKTKKLKQALHYALIGYEKMPESKIMRFTVIWALETNGWQSFKNKQIKKAVSYFKKSVEIDPLRFSSWNGYGAALKESKNPSNIHTAVYAFNKAFGLNPNIDYVFANLQDAYRKSYYTYLKHCNIEKAIGLAKKWLSFYNRGRSYYKKYNFGKYSIIHFISGGLDKICSTYNNDLAKKINVLKLFLKHFPDNYKIIYSLGTSFYKYGNKELGHKYMMKAYSVFKEHVNRQTPFQIISVPLKGYIKPVKYIYPLPPTHSGLWIHAVDYLVYDANGKDITANSPVYSPVKGVVAGVTNNSRDLGEVRIDYTDRQGFKLTVQLVHLKQGSISVKTGQKVNIGDKLGDLKINGAHLHMHIWDKYGVSVAYLYKTYRLKSGKTINNKKPKYGEIFLYP